MAEIKSNSSPDQVATTVLVVDDESTNLSVLGQFLAPNYEVLVATSGAKALQLANADPKPDLILLDVMMPGMDGYQVVGELKANESTCNIPVIFVTALTSGSEEERGLELGAVDYVNKPCNLPILQARIRTHLELKRARDILKDQNAFLESELERRHQENQQMQSQLLQSEKLAAIGQLAAGIAHEINNPIGFVFSNLNTLNNYLQDIFNMLDAYEAFLEQSCVANECKQKLAELKQLNDLSFLRGDIPQLIAESREGLIRVRDIIQDLGDFAHLESSDWVCTDLHKNIDSTLNILSNELKDHCRIVKEYGEIPQVMCLSTQLNQVFMNLLINAGQAIGQQGEIRIRSGCDGQEAWVEISDTGNGIAPEHLSRVFEPFFTTKPVGKGTGLGLSVSQNIVRKHGGRIEVKSLPGQGSSFTVHLPLKQNLRA